MYIYVNIFKIYTVCVHFYMQYLYYIYINKTKTFILDVINFAINPLTTLIKIYK